MKAVLRPSINDLIGRAVQLHGAGQLANALAAYDQILALAPSHAGAFCARGDVLADLGRLDLAIASYDRAIALEPNHVDAHDFRGIALAQLGRGREALASFDRAVALAPDNPNALGNRANMLLTVGRVAEALLDFDHILALHPDFPVAHVNRGAVLVELGRVDEAIASYDQAIALQPSQVEAHMNRAVALARTGRHSEAIAGYKRVIELQPSHGRALEELAKLLKTLGEPLEAAAYHGRAFAMQPDQFQAHISHSKTLTELKRLEDELATYRQAAARFPMDAIPVGNIAATLIALGRLEEAIAESERALALNPKLAYVHRNLSIALSNLGQLAAAIESYDRAVALDPKSDDIPGTRLIWSLHMCQWDGLKPRIAEIERRIEAGVAATPALTFLLFNDSPALQRKCAEAFAATNFAKTPATPIAQTYPRHDRIRVGYFSADFHLHATMQLLAETLEAHDRSRFELFGFSFGLPSGDDWRRRAIVSMDHFFDIRPTSTANVVRQARELELDIAVDLKGFTQGARTDIFAERVAPIQVNFLGYPGTMGAYFDYLIADRVLVPEASKAFYSEKIAFLPGSYQPNCREREIGAPPLTRRDVGLPDDGLVYCCHNQSYKITPEMFDVWMNILRATEPSVLWLWITQKATADNLLRHAADRGVDPNRIVFATSVGVAEHLNRLRLADVFLDTLPYTAHTTGSDALRMGVPLVTCAGASFAARVAASLLTAVEMPELVTHSLEDYQALAIALGTDHGRRAALKQKLEAKAQASSLYDGTAFARKLERAYAEMYRRYQDGLPPDHIHLEDEV